MDHQNYPWRPLSGHGVKNRVDLGLIFSGGNPYVVAEETILQAVRGKGCSEHPKMRFHYEAKVYNRKGNLKSVK